MNLFYKKIRKISLMLISNDQWATAQSKRFFQQVVDGGVNCIQLRDKHWTDEKIKIASHLIPYFQQQGVTIVINDHVDLARRFNTGLHVGQDDIHPLAARKILGFDAVIGLTIEDLHQLEAANQLVLAHPNSVDYVACTAVFPSNSKACRTFWELKGLSLFAEKSLRPVVAIGGVKTENAADMLAAGANSLAVLGALYNAKNPKQTAQTFAEIIAQGEQQCRL